MCGRSKHFFFEKKKKKTFVLYISGGARGRAGLPTCGCVYAST
jgi:hypothetical protein